MKYYLLVFVFFATACVAPPPLFKHYSGDKNVRLETTGTVYISIPSDGWYKNTRYRGSGLTTASEFQKIFNKYAKAVYLDDKPQTIKEALLAAREKNAKYLLYTTILHWEDRATAWSGIPDKIRLKVDVIEIASSKTLTSDSIYMSNRNVDVLSDDPEDLLPEPINKYVSNLYGVKVKKEICTDDDCS